MYSLSFLQCAKDTVVCDQIANKSFVQLNASILGEYREKPSLRSASHARHQDSVTGGEGGGGHKQIFGGAHKFCYFESESVDQKKGFHIKICADFHEFWGEDKKSLIFI